MLSSSQLDHYHNKGYVVPEFRLDNETLDTIKGHHERLTPAGLNFETIAQVFWLMILPF